jgi:hypothetical protein
VRVRNPQWVAGVAVLVVLGGGGAAGWSHWHDSAAAPATVVKATPPTIADAHAVALALAKLPEKPEDYIATDVRSAVAPQVAGALPPGATLTADESTWHPDGLDGGTITVTMTAPATAPATFSVIMIKEPSGWKVVGTVPMAPGNAAAPPTVGPAPVASPTPMPTDTPSPTPTAKTKAKSKPKPKPRKTATPSPGPTP